MLTRQGIFVAIAVAWLIVTVALVGLAAVALILRRGGRRPGRAFEQATATLGGGELGILFLVTGDVVTKITFALTVGAVAMIRWRRGRRTDAGWLVVGAALPWALLWMTYLWALMNAWNDFDPGPTLAGFAAGATVFGVGLAIVGLGDRDPAPPGIDSPRWAPGSRTIGTVAAAIRAGNAFGPIGAAELGMLVALVATQVGLSLALALFGWPLWLRLVVLVPVSALLATEAYFLAMPGRYRRAFEAFSWLGEWGLARLRDQTGEGPPLNRRAAERWLERHPDEPDIRWARAEVLVVADHLDEALVVAEGIPVPDRIAGVEREATLGFVRWMRGETVDLGALVAVVEALPPATDDRLRAEVMLAAARVRERMADGRSEPGDAAQPLIAVRDLLGDRAKGQVRLALRDRILRVLLLLGAGFAALQLILDALGQRPAL
jgi:hypothetical protein